MRNTIIAGLVIEQDSGVYLEPSQKPVFMVTMKNIECLHLTGAGSFVNNGQICGDKLRIIVEGAGDIDLNICYDEVVSVISGTGNIDLESTAPLAEHLIEGVGNIRAYELSSNNVKAVISGVGDVRITANNYLQAVVYGVGHVIYHGNPRVSSRVDGIGSVRSR